MERDWEIKEQEKGREGEKYGEGRTGRERIKG